MSEIEKVPPAPLENQGLFRRRDAGRKIPPFFKRLPYTYLLHFLFCFLLILFQSFTLPRPYFEKIEYIFLDYFFSSRSQQTTDPSIAYIEVAEDGLSAIGRWPWPRQYHAALAHFLTQWGARAVVFDMIFSEPSTELDDGALKEAIEQSGRVYLSSVLEGEGGQKQWIESLPIFTKAAKGVGHINIFPDSDGKIRRIEPFLDLNGKKYPHLALRLASDMMGQDPEVLAQELPLDSRGTLMVNWAGKWKDTFKHYSYVDLLKSFELEKAGQPPLIPRSEIQGKVCMIGLTAFGHTDIKPVPMELLYPALGLHANVLNSLLVGRYVEPASDSKNRLVMFVVGLLSSLLFVWFRSVAAFLSGLGLGVLWAGAAFMIFKNSGTWFLVFHPLILILSLYIFSTAYTMIIQNRERLGLLFLATRDGLTGLYVIRHFRFLLNQAVIQAAQKKETLSLILMDIDHFKKINDTYGHQAGDLVLKEVSNILQKVVRQMRPKNGDIVARYGGEELIIYLKNCSLLEASRDIAETIRASIQDAIIHYKGLRISVTISLGVSTLHPGEHIPDVMVTRADNALYVAKRSGRNQVRVESDEMPASEAGSSQENH